MGSLLFLMSSPPPFYNESNDEDDYDEGNDNDEDTDCYKGYGE